MKVGDRCIVVLKGHEVVRLRCECLHGGHESCIAKSVCETRGGPICRAPLLRYRPPPMACTHGDIEKARHLLESDTYHSSRDTFDGIQAAQHGHREVIHS